MPRSSVSAAALSVSACLVFAAPASARPLGALSVQEVLPAGSLVNCTEIVGDPTDPATLYLLEKAGRVRICRNGALLAQDFANLATIVKSNTLEEGLLGMAFSPTFATDRRVYFNFTSNQIVPAGQQVPPAGATIVARFVVPPPAQPGDPLAIDFASRFDLDFNADLGVPGQRWIQQFSNHKGGHLRFNMATGHLHMGMGDGGGQNDPSNRGQTPTTLLGKLLRINVNVPDNDPEGYDIPASNPFLPANNPPVLDPFYGAPLARPHIWHFGVRNPWKWEFDDFFPLGYPDNARSNDFYLADVGQFAWEEVDRAPGAQGGINWGWRRREGAHDFNVTLPPAYLPLTDPMLEYSHGAGLSITGGYVYRGKAMCSFQGRYFYADYQNGRVWSSKADGTDIREHTNEMFGATRFLLGSFGRDAAGELYLVHTSAGTGRLWKIVSNDTPLVGDINGDRMVTFADLNLVLSSFGTVYTFARLNQVLSEFGLACGD